MILLDRWNHFLLIVRVCVVPVLYQYCTVQHIGTKVVSECKGTFVWQRPVGGPCLIHVSRNAMWTFEMVESKLSTKSTASTTRPIFPVFPPVTRQIPLTIPSVTTLFFHSQTIFHEKSNCIQTMTVNPPTYIHYCQRSKTASVTTPPSGSTPLVPFATLHFNPSQLLSYPSRLLSSPTRF